MFERHAGPRSQQASRLPLAEATAERAVKTGARTSHGLGLDLSCAIGYGIRRAGGAPPSPAPRLWGEDEDNVKRSQRRLIQRKPPIK